MLEHPKDTREIKPSERNVRMKKSGLVKRVTNTSENGIWNGYPYEVAQELPFVFTFLFTRTGLTFRVPMACEQVRTEETVRSIESCVQF